MLLYIYIKVIICLLLKIRISYLVVGKFSKHQLNFTSRSAVLYVAHISTESNTW